MNPAPNLILIGSMGAGKSSLGRRLAAHFGLAFVDTDEEIIRHTGASIATIFEYEGEAGFRQRERAALAEVLAADNQVVATGGGIVLDADNRILIEKRGFVLYLHVDLEQQLARLSHDRTRPLLARNDRELILRTLSAERLPLYRALADLEMDTSADTLGDAFSFLAQQLDAHWQRPRSQALAPDCQ